jgi:hypothetical protein
MMASRAVTAPQDSSSLLPHVLVSEILMGVNIMKRVDDCPNKCLFVTVNHVRSPMVPMMIAKRIGLQAAVNYIHDLNKAAAAAAAAAAAKIR